ncbi:beta-ketoacyl synthase N-terminal-like domain-containing protein [Bacteroidota bacterium]
MKKEKISITSMASISALGDSNESVWENYLSDTHFLSNKNFGKFSALVGSISEINNVKIEELRNSDSKYKSLDRSVLLAIYTSRKALENVNWLKDFGVNIGSSRGATELFEKHYDSFKESSLGKAETLSSPTTTLGNIASWVAHDLQAEGPAISHSITCSTALHAVVNGVAWLRSGMSNAFLVGGSEAANTPFTIAQMKALKIYSKDLNDKYPCKALDLSKEKNGMVVGEGAVSFCLERGIKENALAVISGLGYATEKLKHNISISADAQCFQKSMKMALEDAGLNSVDAIVMHAPGTIKGDLSEYKAIQVVFGDTLPALTTNKWKMGHTLGASGVLSMELAILMLAHQKFVSVPFIDNKCEPRKITSVLINAVGFGGNAVSIILSKP